MSKLGRVQLLLNDEQIDHGKLLGQLLSKSTRLECIVAFARMSGMRNIENALKKSLQSGLVARFAIGLSLNVTEPDVLRMLLKLSGKHSLKLYIGDPDATFHPKMYALSNDDDCTVLIGSANLTGGGLHDNYEASAWIEDPKGALMESVSTHIDDLIEWGELKPATSSCIDDYERRYLIARAQQRLAKRREKRAISCQHDAYIETLSDILSEMKQDDSEFGFVAQRILRLQALKDAACKINEIASMDKMDSNTFLKHYEELIHLFHSGGLERGKTIVAKKPHEFQAALAATSQVNKLSPDGAFDLLLGHFRNIDRAGTNVLTEILQAIDCNRFAVMNKNAVSGLRLANIHGFPLEPNKKNVNAERYNDFCQKAELVRKKLGLANFAELDALFNYAYWK